MKSILTDLVLPDKVLCHCFSYISIPVIKQHDQGHLEEEVFNWTYSFSVLECVIAEQGVVAGASESSRLGPQAGGKEGTQEMGLVFWNHKATPVTHFLQYHTSQSFPMNSINWDKVFKHTLWGPFSSKPSQTLYQVIFIHCQCFTTRRQWKAEH